MGKWHLQLLSGLALLLGLGAYSQAAGDDLPRKIYQQTLHSTAWVIAIKDKDNIQGGTGWVVDRARHLVVTNHHVVHDQGKLIETIIVMFPAYERGSVVAERTFYIDGVAKIAIKAKLLKTNPTRDLALIQLESLPADATALTLAADSPSPGDRLHSIGNPGASSALWVYSSGTVRQVYKSKVESPDQKIDARQIESTLPINNGDSGGPVVNDSGELVGVNSSVRDKSSLITHSIDVREVRDFLVTEAKVAPTVAKGAADYEISAGVAWDKGNYEGAVRDYTEAIELDPTRPSAYTNRAGAYLLLSQYDKAIADCEEAIRLNGKLPQTYLNRGLAYLQKTEYERAVSDFSEAIKLNPNYAQAYQRRSQAFAKLGKNSEAQKDQEKANSLKASK
jgi:S1-C subfamily serine protease